MGKRVDKDEVDAVEQDLLKHYCSIGQILKERGVSRRDFLKFCSAMTAAMALPASFAPKVAQALDELVRLVRESRAFAPAGALPSAHRTPGPPGAAPNRKALAPFSTCTCSYSSGATSWRPSGRATAVC